MFSIARRQTGRGTKVANNLPRKFPLESIHYGAWLKALRAISLAEVIIISRISSRVNSDHAVDGLTRMFAVIKTTDDVRDLPPDFQAVLEWGRISLVTHR